MLNSLRNSADYDKGYCDGHSDGFDYGESQLDSPRANRSQEYTDGYADGLRRGKQDRDDALNDNL